MLIDAETLLHGEHPESVIDCGVPIDLPVETLRRWACCADITPIIVAADGVSLYLGRSSRTANLAQRRALRAMYETCAVPGCTATFDDCAIHHGVSKSLYAADPDGIEFEVMWAVPKENWPTGASTERLDLDAELARWAAVDTADQ